MPTAKNIQQKKPDPTDVHVGGRIRLQRNLIGMSQSELGLAIGVTFQQVQKYEKGTNRVGASRLRQISEILGAPVSFFFEDDNNSNVVSINAEASYPLMEFLATKQGLELNRAFLKIKDPKVREKAVQLMRAMAASGSDS